jgi:hypothetical protein
MIVVGMSLLAIISAAVGYAAVRVANGSPRLVVLKRQRRLLLWTEKKSFSTFFNAYNYNQNQKIC